MCTDIDILEIRTRGARQTSRACLQRCAVPDARAAEDATLSDSRVAALESENASSTAPRSRRHGACPSCARVRPSSIAPGPRAGSPVDPRVASRSRPSLPARWGPSSRWMCRSRSRLLSLRSFTGWAKPVPCLAVQSERRRYPRTPLIRAEAEGVASDYPRRTGIRDRDRAALCIGLGSAPKSAPIASKKDSAEPS